MLQVMMWKVQWCPRVTTAINKILFWKSMLKCETDSVVGLSILHTRARKAGLKGIPYQGEHSITQMQEYISNAYKQFIQLKKEDNCHYTWLEELIEAQAEAWNHSK